MLNELSATLAHELNQPLTAILSNSQAAQRYLHRESPDLLALGEILDDLVASSNRAGAVIRRLRTMLRKDEAKFIILDLNQAVDEVLKLMHSDLLDRGIEVVRALAPGPVSVLGDSVRLQQVLLNLVANCSDAMAGQTQRRLLHISTGIVNGQAMLVVSDNGKGIPAENLEQIFQPFITTKNNGLGLGLGICRQIIESHGGRSGPREMPTAASPCTALFLRTWTHERGSGHCTPGRR
ncbi:MAG: hypothetical protein HC814_07310 [Rhodobacteraceae bacterium]|nr:hypothetical protein [Paracoccaceae bacterium]